MSLSISGLHPSPWWATVHTGRRAPPARTRPWWSKGTPVVSVTPRRGSAGRATVHRRARQGRNAGPHRVWTQLGLVEIEGNRVDAGMTTRGGDPVRAAHRVVDAFNPASEVIPRAAGAWESPRRSLPQTRADRGAGGGLRARRLRGWHGLVAPNVGMVVSYGATGGPSRSAVLAGLREVFADARRLRAPSGGVGEEPYRPLAASHLDLDALQPVLEGKVPLLVRVARKADILAILEFARSERVRVVLVGATEAWQVADVLARAQVPVVVDPVENAPESFDQLGARADAAARLERAGVPVLLSTFSTHNARKLRQWAGNAVREGMSHAGALRAITATPAQVFGLARLARYPGKRADLVVWSGDPFEPLTRSSASRGGRDISLRHRQRALAERYRCPARALNRGIPPRIFSGKARMSESAVLARPRRVIAGSPARLVNGTDGILLSAATRSKTRGALTYEGSRTCS